MTPIRLMLCSSAALALAGCGPKPIKVGLPPPPDEWLVCADAPARPDLAPLGAITLPDGARAYPKVQTDARDAVIARYIIDLRSAWGDCAGTLARLRDYYAAGDR